jgi:serpin B
LNNAIEPLPRWLGVPPLGGFWQFVAFHRLFAQVGYALRADFLTLIQRHYGQRRQNGGNDGPGDALLNQMVADGEAPLEMLDFQTNPPEAVKRINSWVEAQTQRRICGLIPQDALNELTRMVLVNAIYLKASWAHPLLDWMTEPLPFHVRGGEGQPVVTMYREGIFGCLPHEGFCVVTLPCVQTDIHGVILLPDAVNGLAQLEATLSPDLLAAFTKAKAAEVKHYLPKFRIEPPLLSLGTVLQSLGVKSAFDIPKGSADFGRMASREPDDYLFIAEVFHKTFLEVNENGMEAAAATGNTGAFLCYMPGARCVTPEIRVDRPFLFAIQHRPSGVCLFLGRVTDPR